MDDLEVLVTVRAALADLDAAHDRALEAIKAEPDRNSALKAVGELASHLRNLNRASDALRTQLAGEIWEAEKLSLSALAERIGVSKARADQLIKAIKRQRSEGVASDG